MESSEAREHLDLVDRILTQADQSLNVGGEFFVVWGCASAALDLIAQLILDRRLASSWLLAAAAILAAAIVFTIVRVRQMRRNADRGTVMQREYLNVLWVALGVTAVAQVCGSALFPVWGQAALWTLAGSIVTFYIPLHGNGRALLGGIVLLASLIIANFSPHIIGYVLAAGMLIGYTGFGISTLLARD